MYNLGSLRPVWLKLHLILKVFLYPVSSYRSKAVLKRDTSPPLQVLGGGEAWSNRGNLEGLLGLCVTFAAFELGGIATILARRVGAKFLSWFLLLRWLLALEKFYNRFLSSLRKLIECLLKASVIIGWLL